MGETSPFRRTVWNDDERRPRAPWRLLAWLAISVVLAVAVVTPVFLAGVLLGDATLARWFPGRDPATVVTLVATAAQNVGLVAAVAIVAWVVDRRRYADLGLGVDREWGLGCLAGLALGGGLILGIAAVEYAAGWATVAGTARPVRGTVPTMALYTVVFVVASVGEEVVFRGYLLTNVAEGLADWGPFDRGTAAVAAVVTTAALFGIVHLGNPDGGPVGAGVIVLGGLLLGTAYVVTDSLAIPVGFHVGWNWTQGSALGYPVSGLANPPGLVRVQRHGPEAMTGGSFGPEAGLLGGGAFLVGLALVLAWGWVRHGRIGPAAGVTTPDLRWRVDP